MSKYLPFFILLFSLTTNAQQPAEQSNGSQKINQLQPGSPAKSSIWDEQEPYVNGFARVLYNNKFAFIDKLGKPVCPVNLDGARNFSNHLAAVSKENKWGFINETGDVIIPLNYEIVFDFTGPITGAFAKKKWWLINTNGEVLQSLDVTTFYGFNNGIAKINKDGRWGTVNTKGEINFTAAPNTSLNNDFAPFKPKNAQLNTAITACPDNIDFEFGSFLNWQCFIGHVDSVGTTNVITVAPSPPTPNRHTLYPRALPSPLDAFGLFPTNPPDGSNFALRLGNTKVGAEAERVRYTVHVPVNDSNFSIKYDYAVVFQDPGHTPWTQPRFTVKVFDSAANTYVACASFEYISTSSLPGFARSTVDNSVIFKPWSSVFLSLRGYAGKTMYLEFTTADCVRKGHWGYAYVDVEKPCGQSVDMNYECDSPHVTTLTGPAGFQFYNWWDSAFSTILGTGQTVILNPGPPINSIIWLETIPYTNFGCRDTIAVKITGTFTADFGVSDTTGICAPHTFTFYNHHIPSTSAIWDFGDGTFGSGDTVTHTYNLPGNYVVKLNAVLPGGCIGEGIRLVSVLQPTGSFSFDQTFYCNTQTARFDAVVIGGDSLFWNFGDGTILHTLQTTVFHTYTVAGIFIPTLTVRSLNGCQSVLTSSDTIKVEILRPGFKNTNLKLCGSTTFNFTDTSYSYFGITSRLWDFGDGTTGSGINVSHNYTAAGTYNIRLIINGINGCIDSITKPITVVINAVPFVSITGDTLRCQSSAVTFTSNVVSLDSVNYYRWTTSNGFSGIAPNFTNTFNTAGTFTIQLIIRTINGCYDTATHLITINPTPDVFLPPNQDLCNGDMTAAINFSGSFPGTSFTWTNTGPIIGLAASGSGNIAPFIASSNGASIANAGITVKPTANGCPGPTKIFTITVHPTPTVLQPVSQVLCNGSSTSLVSFSGAVAGTTYQWVNSNPLIGLPASGNGDINSFVTTNPTNAPITAIITVTPSAGNCTGVPKTFTIKVNPTPDAAQPADQQLCNGSMTAAVNFTGSVSGTVYTWTNNTPSIGLAASGTGNIPSFAAITSASAITVATITVSPTASGCSGAGKTFTITVSPIATVNQPANQVLCNGSTTNPIAFTGLVSGTVYNWTNNTPSIGLAASGTGDINSFTVSNTGSTPITATITVTPVTTDCPGVPKTFTIKVNPTPDAAQPADQQLCNGSMTAAVNFTGSVSGTVYTWTNNTPSIGLAASGTGNIPSFAAITSASAITVATITVSPTASGCSGAGKTFTITVSPIATVNQPANQVLCNGSTTNPIAFTGLVSGTVYNWTNNTPSIGLAASGTGDINSFTVSNTGSTPITATITVTPVTTDCPGVPKTFTIKVNPTPDAAQPADQQLCNGSMTAAVNFTGSVSGTVYTWTNNTPSIGLAASGTGNIPSFAAITSASAITVATITVSPTASGCSGAGKTFTITVSPIATVNQPANQVLCNGSTTNPIAFTGLVSGTVYNWTNNTPSIGLAASGTGDINSFTVSNTGSTPITATITVTPVTTDCPGVPKTFTIKVNPTPDAAQPADQQLCNGSMTAAVNFTGSVSGTVYTWTNNTPSIGLAASGTGNIPSFAAITSASAITVATITVSPTASGCSGAGKTFTITVSPIATVNQPANQVLCNGSTTNPIAFTGLVSGTVYNWTNNTPSIGLAASGTGDINSFTVSNTGSTPITATITVTPVTTDCPGVPKTFTIKVNPTPDAAQPADQQLCNGSMTAAVNFTGSVSGTVYTWTNNTPSIGLAASGTGNIPSFAAITSASAITVATITVSPTASGCSGAGKTFTITANPLPTVSQPSNQAICNGAIVNSISFTGLVSGTTYNWTNNNTAIGLPAAGTGDINAFTGINTTANPITATITVTPQTTDCPGAAKTFTITVNPIPKVVATSNSIVCLGKPIQLGASGAAQYTWSPVDHLSCVNCSNPVAQPVDSIQYIVKGTSSFGCIAFDSVMLSVIKPFKMQVSPNDTLCIGESTGIRAFNASKYLWSPSIGLSKTNIPDPSVKITITTTYSVIGFDNYNCFTDTGYVTVVVGPKPHVNLGPDRTLTTGTPLTLSAIVQNGPIIKWEWSPSSELSCNNCANPSTVVRNNSIYTVVVTNNFGCVATDTVLINSLCKSAQVFIPNAFTPDGDGLNDILMVRGRGITVKSFRIFNRWGELVFEKENFYPDDPRFGWDGKVRGVLATPDVFVYTAEVFCDNGVIYTYKGNTTLLK